MEGQKKMEEKKMEMNKKSFEFSRNEIVKKFEEKFSGVILRKLKITNFEGTVLLRMFLILKSL